jgi:hypothetical protein
MFRPIINLILYLSTIYSSAIVLADTGMPQVPDTIKAGQTLVLTRNDSYTARVFFSPLWKDVSAYYQADNSPVQVTCIKTEFFLNMWVEDRCSFKLDKPGQVRISWWERAGFSFEKFTHTLTVEN